MTIDKAASRKQVSTAVMQDWGLDGIIKQLSSNNYLEDAFIRHGITPDKLEFIMDDDEIASCWEKRSLAVEHLKWGLSDPDTPVSLFVWEQLNTWYSRIAADLLTAVLYGLSCPEITYVKNSVGQTVISHVQQHPVNRFAVDNRGHVHIAGMGERIDIAEHPVFKHKFFPVLNRRTSKRPAGTPLLASLVWVWFLRGNVWQYWARHLERFGSPQWVGKAATGFDPATGKTNAESMAEMLAYAVASGVVVVGNDEEAQAVDVSGNGGASFETADKRIAGRIQKRILGQTLTTETSGTGSYAMASVHDDVRQEIAAADIALITPAIQAIVNSLVELNYPGTVPPIFAIEHQTGLNEDRAKRDVDLYGQGVRFTQEYYTRVYDFDAAEITIDSTQPARPMQFKHIPQQANRFMFADNQPVDQGQLELDAMLSDALQQAGSSIEADALKAIVLKAKNPDDLADRLVKFYDETTPDGNYVDTLAALLFAADVLGYEQADMGVIE